MHILDQEFWARFAKTTWEKKSVTFKNIQSPLLELDQAEIFKLLVTYSDRCRRLKSADGMKFYIQGHRQFDSEVIRHLPKKSDRDLAGYHERMSSQYDDYCLVCDELLQVNHDRQDNLIEFTSLLFANVGLPNRFAEMGLYLGNYRKTPFGVHEDACGVFSFPVAGKKKFRIWKPNFVRRNPQLVRAFSYAKYKRASQVLEAVVGDMTYWPSSAWHIAESDGTFSATWSLGVWVDKKQSETVSEVTNAVFKNRLGALGESTMTALSSKKANTGEMNSLPDAYVQALSSLKSISHADLESAFREAWLAHFSKNGLKSSPSSAIDLKNSKAVRLRNPRQPVRWMRDGSTTIYAFNGTTVRTSSKSLFKFLMSLNQGRALRVPKDFAQLKPLVRAGAFSSREATFEPAQG